MFRVLHVGHTAMEQKHDPGFPESGERVEFPRTMLTGFRPSFVPAKKFFEELQNRYVALWFELHLLYEATLHPPPF